MHDYTPTAATLEFLRECRIPESRIIRGCATLQRLAEQLNRENRHYNLTRLSSPALFWHKHVADSMAILQAYPELAEAGLSVADIGCGSGFPLFPLACFMPHWQLTGIEATGKKAEFVARAAGRLGIGNLVVIHRQAREAARLPEWQDRFDLITARAVGPAGPLLRQVRPLLKSRPTAQVILYKTPRAESREKEELERECGKLAFAWQSSPILQLPEKTGTRQFWRILPRLGK